MSLTRCTLCESAVLPTLPRITWTSPTLTMGPRALTRLPPMLRPQPRSSTRLRTSLSLAAMPHTFQALGPTVQIGRGAPTTTMMGLATSPTCAPWDILPPLRGSMPRPRCVPSSSPEIIRRPSVCGPRYHAVVRRHRITSLFMPRRWRVPAGKMGRRRARTTVFQYQHVTVLALAKLLCVLLRVACAVISNVGAAAGSSRRPG